MKSSKIMDYYKLGLAPKCQLQVENWKCIVMEHYVPAAHQSLYHDSEEAVHKVRHAIFGQFWPPLPSVTLCHTSWDPQKVRHTSWTSLIFSRPS